MLGWNNFEKQIAVKKEGIYTVKPGVADPLYNENLSAADVLCIDECNPY